ncbi:MAG TPA: hypothetical protein VLW25_03855 [Bryobacteraceae bacterium]|nr:hypothetical protein [Bryobacteraceae bacterium]
MPQPPDEIARNFRAAILAADHELARRLASEYTEAVAELWRVLPEPARSASALPRQVGELLTWARGMTIVQRAILSEQLAVLEKAMHYATDQTPRQRSSIQISL